MAPSTVHLPNGQHLTVTPVFGGLSFKSNDLSTHRSAFPPGWTINLNEEDDDEDAQAVGEAEDLSEQTSKRPVIHRYKRPSLQNDHLFISAISNPSSAEFRPATSPTRQIAMMLWASLWWYFHQLEPVPPATSKPCEQAADSGIPKGEWIININREGIFKSKNLLAKLERMSLISSDDSSVGSMSEDIAGTYCRKMFVSRRAFWQMDARTYLFTLSPVINSPLPGGSPINSRPSSPQRNGSAAGEGLHESSARGVGTPGTAPFHSSSHLPTYYPPHPTQYTFSRGVRHPLRPRPFRQGETFYTRYVPSVGQYLSFRVASLSTQAVSRHGPWSPQPALSGAIAGLRNVALGASDSMNPALGMTDAQGESDVDLLHKWMNEPRVSTCWGEQGPRGHQEDFLRKNLQSKHSVPCIGCWDGKPFGYFEIYWAKEDVLGRTLGSGVDDFDRGIHCLVGEQEFRGPHRVQIWLSALVHYCWLADMRTNCVMLEPRVDNEKLRRYCEHVGFFKEREVVFPHKRSSLMKILRDGWEKPQI